VLIRKFERGRKLVREERGEYVTRARRECATGTKREYVRGASRK
jgi:hypothetical protein